MFSLGSRFSLYPLFGLVFASLTRQSWSLRRSAPHHRPGPDCLWAERLARANAKAPACQGGDPNDPGRVGNFSFTRPFRSPRRIGLVIRGESFRRGTGQGSRNDSIVTADGWHWQNLASTSHLEQVIHPFEACGFEVDVFIGTYDHEGNQISRHPVQDLELYYAPRVHGTLVVPSSRKRKLKRNGFWEGDYGAATMYEESFRLLAKRHEREGVSYDAVLVTRHDVIFTRPLTSWPDVEWDKVVFPFREALQDDSVSDVFQWFPWRYARCASLCGFSGHGLGACLTEHAGTDMIAFVLPGVHNSNTQNEYNPIYALVRPVVSEQRTAVLVAGDVGRLPAKKAHSQGPYIPLRVTGGSFVKHVLDPNNRHVLDPHKRLDVFVHSFVPGLERDYRLYFNITRAAYNDTNALKALMPTFEGLLGHGVTDWRDIAWAYSLHQAALMMKQFELERGNRYKHVIIVRPDTILLHDLNVDEIMKEEDAIYVNGQSNTSSPRYFHFIMSRNHAVDFANVYFRFPLKVVPRNGRTWLSIFVEDNLHARFIQDNITAGVDEEAYMKIPEAMGKPCQQAQLSRMRDVGFTADDARELGMKCGASA